MEVRSQIQHLKGKGPGEGWHTNFVIFMSSCTVTVWETMRTSHFLNVTFVHGTHFHQPSLYWFIQCFVNAKLYISANLLLLNCINISKLLDSIEKHDRDWLQGAKMWTLSFYWLAVALTSSSTEVYWDYPSE